LEARASPFPSEPTLRKNLLMQITGAWTHLCDMCWGSSLHFSCRGVDQTQRKAWGGIHGRELGVEPPTGHQPWGPRSEQHVGASSLPTDVGHVTSPGVSKHSSFVHQSPFVFELNLYMCPPKKSKVCAVTQPACFQPALNLNLT
jgi:hypothetical protein